MHFLPKRLRLPSIQPDEFIEQVNQEHYLLKSTSATDCQLMYMKIAAESPLFGATLFKLQVSS